MSYVLHYAPDNASLIIRLALEHRGLPYTSMLVDRARAEQTTEAYRALNPTGLIPTLETPFGPIHETAAILLWLADTHGGLGPAPTGAARGDFLKWLFYTSNTLHPVIRQLFYPAQYIAEGLSADLQAGIIPVIQRGFATLDDVAARQPAWLNGDAPSVLDFYVAGLMRWPALYPRDSDRTWFDAARYPALLSLCARIETLPCCAALHRAEGLGHAPFTDPQPAQPPEGSAT